MLFVWKLKAYSERKVGGSFFPGHFFNILPAEQYSPNTIFILLIDKFGIICQTILVPYKFINKWAEAISRLFFKKRNPYLLVYTDVGNIDCKYNSKCQTVWSIGKAHKNYFLRYYQELKFNFDFRNNNTLAMQVNINIFILSLQQAYPNVSFTKSIWRKHCTADYGI